MAIKKYVASADTTIVNAYRQNLETRGTGSNAGAADVMEVFSVYGRQSTSSAELCRALVKFPVASVKKDRTAGTIPASGSVSFYMKLFNAKTSKTVPVDYTLMIQAVSQSWQEGIGLDLEDYKDVTKGNPGANWMSASNSAYWANADGTVLAGGSYHTRSFGGGTAGSPNEIHVFSQSFTTGLEDLEVDITPLVEQWIAETWGNYGVGVHLTASQEAKHSGSAPSVEKRYPGYPALDRGGNDKQNVLYNPSGSTESYYTKSFLLEKANIFINDQSSKRAGILQSKTIEETFTLVAHWQRPTVTSILFIFIIMSAASCLIWNLVPTRGYMSAFILDLQAAFMGIRAAATALTSLLQTTLFLAPRGVSKYSQSTTQATYAQVI